MADPRAGRNLAVVGLCGFLFTFGYTQLVLLPVFLKSRGVDFGAIGLIMSALPMTAMFMRPFGGQLVGRFGGRPIVVVSSVIFAAVIPAYALVPTNASYVFAVLRGLQGFGAAGLSIALTILAAGSDTQQHRARAIGYASVFGALGGAVGPLAAESLYRSAGALPMFILSSCCCLGCGLAALAISLPPDPRVAVGTLDVRTYRRTLVRPEMLLLLAIGVSTSTVGSSITNFLPLYASARGIEGASVFFLVSSIGSIAVTGATAGLSDRLGRLRIIAPALLLGIVAPLVLEDVRAIGTVVIAGLAYGIANGLLGPALTASVLDTQPDSRARPVAIGLFHMTSDVGLLVGASGFGFLSRGIGFGPAFAAFASLYAVGLLLTLPLRGRLVAGDPTRREAVDSR